MIRPDGVVDQSYTIADTSTEAGWASDTWFTTGNLSSDRTVTHGDLLAIVLEFTTRNGSDTITAKGLTSPSATSAFTSQHQNACLSFLSSVWANVGIICNILLEFSDGTFGSFAMNHPCSAVGSVAYGSTSGTDEYCLEYQLPFAHEVDGIWGLVSPTGGANFDMVLYEGTTVKASVSIDANAVLATGNRHIEVIFPKVPCLANTTYRVAFKPTTANLITLHYFDVAAAGHLSAHTFGTSGVLGSRVDGGAWNAPTATRKPFAGIRMSGVETNLGIGSGTMQNIEGGFTRA